MFKSNVEAEASLVADVLTLFTFFNATLIFKARVYERAGQGLACVVWVTTVYVWRVVRGGGGWL